MTIVFRRTPTLDDTGHFPDRYAPISVAEDAATATTQAGIATTKAGEATTSASSATTASAEAQLAADGLAVLAVPAPLRYEGRGTGLTTTIAAAFPLVTIAQVQVLDSDATLSDSADWYVLQELVARAHLAHARRIVFPEGTFMMTRTLTFFEKLMDCKIEAHGTELKAVATFPIGIPMVKLYNADNHYTYSRRLEFDGLRVLGNYRAAVGIAVGSNANENLFYNLYIHGCEVGISYENVYYGEISGESIIQNCIVGIQLNSYSAAGFYEINTLLFSNVKINFATALASFPSTLKTVSKGVEINAMLNTIKFSGLTIEGQDYGIWGTSIPSTASAGSYAGVYEIATCYFELMGLGAIYLKNVDTARACSAIISIRQNRFAGPSTITLGTGKYTILGNEETLSIVYDTNNGAAPYSLLTDVSPKNVSISTVDARSDLYLDFRHRATSGDVAYNNTLADMSVYPSQRNALPTRQDGQFVAHASRLRNAAAGYPTLVKNHLALSVMSKPLTFVPSRAENAGPVIQGADGKFYMLSTAAGASLVLTEVKNLYRLENPINGFSALSLHKNIASYVEATRMFCVDIQAYVTKTGGIWVLSGGVRALGKSADFNGLTYGSSWGTPYVWNVELGQGWSWYGTYMQTGQDWYGSMPVDPTHYRVSGTLAQRPATPTIDGFVYYAADEVKHYMWSVGSAVWSDYTPPS